MTTAQGRASFDLKGSTLPLMAVVLKTTDLIALATDLEARMAETPDYFDQDPVLIDLAPIRAADAPLNFDSLIAVLRNHHMVPVAVRGGGPAQMQAAVAAGLCLAPDAPVRAQERPDTEAVPVLDELADPEARAAGSAAALAEPVVQIREVVREVEVEVEVIREVEVPVGSVPTLVIDKPLRSGQQVYARGADLIVLAAVSFGAEVMADGNIHVYGPLRGRALAGVQGDLGARIFTTCLEPQLISIAGIYRTTEVPIAADIVGKPAQVRLVGEKIVIDPL